MGLGSNPLDIRPIMQLGIFKRRLEVNNIGMQLFIVENKNNKVLRHYFPRTFCERWIKWSEVRPHRISDHNIQHSIPTFSFQISGRPIHVSQNKFLLHQSINKSHWKLARIPGSLPVANMARLDISTGQWPHFRWTLATVVGTSCMWWNTSHVGTEYPYKA